MTTVVIDIGNARIKWALAEGGRIASPGHAFHARQGPAAAVEALAASLPAQVDRILVANVAGEAVAAALTVLAARRFGCRPEYLFTSAEALGVRCGYRDPSRLGVDRWIAVVAAHHIARAGGAGRPACVINAGTALTFDAVSAAGEHLGGLILAGPRIAADALARNTRGIGLTPPAGRQPAGLGLLGRSTEEAVGYGALLGPAAAFDRAADLVARELGARPLVLVAGGDAPLIADWLESDIELRADLVLEGLAMLAASAAGGQGGRRSSR